MHVEDPICARHDLDCADRVLPLLEDPRRQTGGVRERSSGDAVLDADVATFRHLMASLRRRAESPKSAARRNGPQMKRNARLTLVGSVPWWWSLERGVNTP
jgi:hypothetical protein